MNDTEEPGGPRAADILGKKVFFLYPSAMIQNTIIQELIQQEFEVYTVRDYGIMLRGLKKYPDSVVFVNINEGMELPAWENWVRSVIAAPDITGACVGILTSTNDEELRGKYLTEIRVQCGFTVVKSDVERATRQILEALRAVNAKGRRKYLRASLTGGATINIPFKDAFINGFIRDISTVGFSCVLEPDPNLAKNALFQGIQIKLQSQLFNVEGIVFGSREEADGVSCYVLLFTQRVASETRARIRRSIQQYLQTLMDKELA
jgi:hypothetical protein